MVLSDVHCERGAGCSKKEGRRDGSVVLDGGAGLSEENWRLKELVVEGMSWVGEARAAARLLAEAAGVLLCTRSQRSVI